MSKSVAIIIGLLLVVLLAVPLYWQRTMETALPVPIMHDSQTAAYTAALKEGLVVSSVLGTGSMDPPIPAAPAGMDPETTIVAYVTLDPTPFTEIEQGDLVSYIPAWPLPPSLSHARVLHQAAQKDRGGWIMSGSANAHYESRWRVTPANYVGTARNIYLWPIVAKPIAAVPR